MHTMGKRSRFHIGMRTVKTVLAVVLAMWIVNTGVSLYSNISVAVLAAIAAVQPTFRESVETCLGQIVGSVFGLTVGILMLQFPVDPIFVTAVSVVLVITVYNYLKVSYAPSLPCLMVVILCTSTDIGPVIPYALGRLWDTVIGLSVGMAVNTLICPYDNSKQIRFTVESLDRELIEFLEEMFDGDKVVPDPKAMTKRVKSMQTQMEIFQNQRLIRHRNRRKLEMEQFRICEEKARELVARIELLSLMGVPGRLSEENRQRLYACGAVIRDDRRLEDPTERDVVINYHVHQILTLRRELLEALGEEIKIAGEYEKMP